MFDTAFILLVIAALLVVVGFCQPLAAHLKLPPTVLLGVVGVALGGFPAILSALGWSAGSDPLADIFVELPVSSATFIYVFLPLLVFEAGIVTDMRRTLEDAAPIRLLGATVATTDPAAFITVFRDVGARRARCNCTIAASSSGAGIISPHGCDPRGKPCPNNILCTLLLFRSVFAVVKCWISRVDRTELQSCTWK